MYKIQSSVSCVGEEHKKMIIDDIPLHVDTRTASAILLITARTLIVTIAGTTNYVAEKQPKLIWKLSTATDGC